MNEIIRFLKNYEILIYIVLGTLAVWQIRKFLLAWEELRSAAFGLEKESAQSRLNSAAVVLVVLLAMTVAEYGLVTYLAPTIPDAQPLPTPTLDLLATPTTTLLPPAEGAEPTLQPTEASGGTPGISGCRPGEVMITSPEPEATVSGIIEIEGTVDIPDFGFYKFEIAPADSQNWLTIQASDLPAVEEQLGFWDTTQLEPGDYQLRLVVTDNQGTELDPCEVSLYVEAPRE